MKFNTAKYHNKKYHYEGMEFDSKLEWTRYLFLKDMESQGVICDLQRQVEFELIPKQMETKPVQLKTKIKLVERVVEQPVTYRADFVYKVAPLMTTVVEDTKGFKTKDYVIKRKLMRWNGNPVREVKKATEPIIQ